MSLNDLGHNLIEYDASLFHGDIRNEEEYAPTSVSESLLKATLQGGGRYLPGCMTLKDVVNIRVKREEKSRPLDGLHAGLWRGEMAIVIGVFGGKDAETEGVAMDVLRSRVERLPEGWKPTYTHGLYRTYRMSTVMREHMKAMKEGRMHNILDDISES